jgi:hypothetical protein
MAIAAGLLIAGPGHVSVHRQVERAAREDARLATRGRRRRGSKLAQIVAAILR